jgi:predicted adenylyl cyclase CyaB
MRSNIEIKARVHDMARLHERAAAISDTPPVLIEQEDIFFNVPAGRLKLRIFPASRGELIYYDRGDRHGPKQSSYVISPTDDPASLQAALMAALGVYGIVRKRRTLYMHGVTRIHLDEVEGLGQFMELEYVVPEGADAAEDNETVREIMRLLDIVEEDLIAGAYVDLGK